MRTPRWSGSSPAVSASWPAGRGWRSLVELFLGYAELARAGGAAARAQLEPALPLTEGQLYARSWVLSILATAAWDAGDVEAGLRFAGDALETAAAVHSAWNRALALHARGLLRMARGEWAAADDDIHQSLATRVELAFHGGIAESLEALAMVAAGLESMEEAARLIGAATALRQRLGTVAIRPVRNRLEALRARLETSLGDEGLAAALEGGAGVPEADFLTWVRRMRGSRSRPSTGWESLTPTERRVAQLAAQGLTNREIATQVFVARGTVKVHLSHVFTKLGLKNRTELAAEVTRRAG